ncbi:hypothetical protein BC952_2617 [Flavobacterium limicola]|uniref:Uncharacterized protein n=1 Tax=Flavobacterium limicola TaxID=180441 RepID=A0A495RYQ8_9FLAO|nr:hypothetical protein BC952_2617 [Flavobacterium limicola]
MNYTIWLLKTAYYYPLNTIDTPLLTKIINQFENQDHGNRCIEKLKNIKKTTYSLPVIQENEDFANESVAYFYIEKSY